MERIEENKEKDNWQEINCLKEQVFLKLPEDWKRPVEKVIAKKFPYNSKPQEIFADLDGRKMITFNLLEKQLREAQVYPAIREMQRLFNHIYPESIRKTARQFKVNAGVSGWFLFTTGGMKYDTAHCMFILPVNEKMMLGSYHFPVENIKEDEGVLLEILKSIQVKDREKNTWGNHEIFSDRNR